MSDKEKLLTEEAIIQKLKRFAVKVNDWHFFDHPYQLQAEEAIKILEMLKEKNGTQEDS